jgi:hypothetical protein
MSHSRHRAKNNTKYYILKAGQSSVESRRDL